VTASTQREHAGQRRAPPHHAPGPTGAIPRARALAVTGQRALVAQRAVMAGVTAVYRARYPAEWALESGRAGADRRWPPVGMARRLIGLLRADDALPLRDEASLAADDAAARARAPGLHLIDLKAPSFLVGMNWSLSKERRLCHLRLLIVVQLEAGDAEDRFQCQCKCCEYMRYERSNRHPRH